MTPIAPHITTFLQKRLPVERCASDHTCESYAYAFKMLFEYASACLKVPPSRFSNFDNFAGNRIADSAPPRRNQHPARHHRHYSHRGSLACRTFFVSQ